MSGSRVATVLVCLPPSVSSEKASAPERPMNRVRPSLRPRLAWRGEGRRRGISVRASGVGGGSTGGGFARAEWRVALGSSGRACGTRCRYQSRPLPVATRVLDQPPHELAKRPARILCQLGYQRSLGHPRLRINLEADQLPHPVGRIVVTKISPGSAAASQCPVGPPMCISGPTGKHRVKVRPEAHAESRRGRTLPRNRRIRGL